MASVRTDVVVSGSTATIRTRGPKNNFRVDVDVPAIADIQLDMSAGEFLFRGIEGNKSVSMWAGEVTMEVGDPQLYRLVDLTVRAGEIQAGPFGGSRGGLMRSFRWDGSGKYTDHCQAFCRRGQAGEVTCRDPFRAPEHPPAPSTQSTEHPSRAILPESVEVSPLLQPPRQC